MSKLPTINHPTYHITLSDGKEFSFRPFLVKDEKVLLQALEADDTQTIFGATKQVIKNCSLDSKVDVDALPLYDMEYIYLNLRAKSINEVCHQAFVCKNETKDESENTAPCNGPIEYDVDLSKIELPRAPGQRIMLTESVGIEMRYPSAELTYKASLEEDEERAAREIILSCITTIYDKDQVYNVKEFSNEELNEWLENLSEPQLNKIADWFEKLPTITHEADIECKRCGFVHKIRLEGLSDFFV